MLIVGDKIGPWEIYKIITSNKYKSIVGVKPINSNNVHNILNNQQFWIMKISDDFGEYENIKNYNLNNCDFFIRTPNNDIYSIGTIKIGKLNYNWFVMEEYCFDCSEKKNYIFNEQIFVKSILDFLKYIHLTYKVIHGDIKLKNVLYKNNNYKICDFETMSPPTNNDLCNESHYNNYYYYMYGCEYNKPMKSFRYDLQALGFMLLCVYNNFQHFEFQKYAQIYYERNESNNKFEKLEELKNRLVFPEKISKYFDIISKVDWYCLDPPSEAIYDEIYKLFNI